MKITIQKLSQPKEWKNGKQGIGIQTTDGTWYNCLLTDEVRKLMVGDTVEVEVKNNFINHENIEKVEPDKSYPETIKEMHNNKQDGMALGNAKSCATQLIVAMITPDMKYDEVMKLWGETVNAVYAFEPSGLPF